MVQRRSRVVVAVPAGHVAHLRADHTCPSSRHQPSNAGRKDPELIAADECHRDHEQTGTEHQRPSQQRHGRRGWCGAGGHWREHSLKSSMADPPVRPSSTAGLRSVFENTTTRPLGRGYRSAPPHAQKLWDPPSTSCVETSDGGPGRQGDYASTPRYQRAHSSAPVVQDVKHALHPLRGTTPPPGVTPGRSPSPR